MKQVNKHDRFFSKCGNMWEVLEVTGSKAKVIRRSYYFEGEWFYPEDETPACFDIASLLGMQQVDAFGFYIN